MAKRSSRPAGRQSSTQKVEVVNPFTGKIERVSAKQYQRYGNKYFYNREYDRLRKSGVKGQELKKALTYTKEVLRGERVSRGQRPSEEFVRTKRRKTKSVQAKGLTHEAAQTTKSGKLDKRSGLTMLRRGNRQKAYEVMIRMEQYGLRGILAELHDGEYRYSEVNDTAFMSDEIDRLQAAYETGSTSMPEDVYNELIDTLISML